MSTTNSDPTGYTHRARPSGSTTNSRWSPPVQLGWSLNRVYTPSMAPAPVVTVHPSWSATGSVRRASATGSPQPAWTSQV